MRTLLILSCFIAGSLIGCSAQCDCGPTGLPVDVAPPTQGHIVATRVTGSACDETSLYCNNELLSDAAPPHSCALYYLHAPRSGTCHLEVDFDNGTSFSTDLELVRSDDCCGSVASTDGRERIEIAMTPAPRDAGVD